MTTRGPLSVWAETLDDHRAWVRGCIFPEEAAALFDTDWGTKLDVIAAIAEQLAPDDTTSWQALGVVFGDALALKTGLEWGEVTDFYGTDPGIIVKGDTEAVVFPMTILSKRAAQGNPPDRDTILWLYDQVVEQAQ